MRVKVALPNADAEKLKGKIVELAEKVEHEETGQSDWEAVRRLSFCFPDTSMVEIMAAQTMLIDPGQFRVINELLQKECKGRGRLETLAFAATATATPASS